jgi:hypothetical protein
MDDFDLKVINQIARNYFIDFGAWHCVGHQLDWTEDIESLCIDGFIKIKDTVVNDDGLPEVLVELSLKGWWIYYQCKEQRVTPASSNL